MRNQLRKYAEGRNKSPGTVAREAYERTRKTPGTTVRARCAVRLAQRLSSRFFALGRLGSAHSSRRRRRNTRCRTWTCRTTPTTASAVRAVPQKVACAPSSNLLHACSAIAKRVLGLLAVGVIGGAVLFKLGLSTLR